MKKMKQVIALSLALILALALIGCGQKAEEKAPVSPTPEPAAETAAPAESESPAAATPELARFPKLALLWNAAEDDADQAALRQTITAELAAADCQFDEFFAGNNQTTQLDQLTAAAGGDYDALVVDIVDAGVTDTTWALLAVAGEKPLIFFDRPMEAVGDEGIVLGMNENIMLLYSATETDGSTMAKALCVAVTALFEEYSVVDAAAQVVIKVPGCSMADGFTNKILIG